MASLVIPDLEESMLTQLRQRAAARGRTPEVEAREILAEVLQPTAPTGWEGANALRKHLAESGRSFSDSTELLREDRDR